MKPVRSEVKEYIIGDVAVYNGKIHGAVLYDVSRETDSPVIRAVNQPLVPIWRKLKFHGTR